jgi:hypothetical protein
MSSAAALVDALFTRKPAPGSGGAGGTDIAVKVPPRGNRPLNGAERAAILLLALGENPTARKSGNCSTTRKSARFP